MTDKEIRIISRKKQELYRKVNAMSLLRFMTTRKITEEILEDKEEIRSQVESVEAFEKMGFLDELMGELGYEWDIFRELYVEKHGKKDEPDDEDDESDDENCDECENRDICPILRARKIMEEMGSISSFLGKGGNGR